MAARSNAFKFIGIFIAVLCLCGPLSAFAHMSGDWERVCKEALTAVPEEQKALLTKQMVDVSIGFGFWERFQRKALRDQFFKDLSRTTIEAGASIYLFEDVKRRAQATFDAMPVGPGAPADIRARISEGQILDEVFVVTHQSVGLQRATAKLLEQPRFADIPRVMLVSQSFFSARRSYANQASIFLFSDGGEVSVPLVGKTVYLAGGFSSLCLARTVKAVIEQATAKGMSKITLHLFPDLTYYTDNVVKLSSQMEPLRAPGLPELVKRTILRNESGVELVHSSGYGRDWSGEFKLPSGLVIRVNLER